MIWGTPILGNLQFGILVKCIEPSIGSRNARHGCGNGCDIQKGLMLETCGYSDGNMQNYYSLK